MAESKASATDTRKSATGTTASGGKHGEKKDENFLMKTAHSIRDKVHEFTDEVKEKTHNLTHGGESKKSKKNKGPKKMTEAKAAAISGSDPTESESDAEEKPKRTTTASSPVKKDKPPTTEKNDTSSSRSPSSSVDGTTISAKKETITPTPPKGPTATPSSNDQKDARPPAAAASSSTKPSGATVKFKEPESEEVESKAAATKGNSNTTQPAPAAAKTKDQVHISFDGVATVDDLLDRIDKAIEQAKIIVEGGKGQIALTIDDNPKAPAPTVADLEKKPVEEKPDETNPEEPIRFHRGDVHTIEDLLVKVNNQPGSRKVVMEKSSETPTSPSGTTSDNEEGPTAPKSILKTSQNPSSMETSTKTASFEDDQVHVNVEGVKSVDELLDRIEDTVQQVPVVISPSASEETKQDSKPSTDISSTAPVTFSVTEKREAPKAPAPPVDRKPTDSADGKSDQKKPTDSGNSKPEEKNPTDSSDGKPEQRKPSSKDDVPTIHVAEHEYEAQSANAQASQNNDQKSAPLPKEKEQEPKPNTNTPSTAPAASSPAGKREAPKAPAPAADRQPEEKKPFDKDDVPPTNVAEQKQEGQSANAEASNNTDQKTGPPPKGKEQADSTEWI